MEEAENPLIDENSDLKSLSTIQKVLILQNLLKEFTSKKQIFINERENLLSKIDNKCYQYFKGRINVKKAFDYILKNDSIMNNKNYSLRKDKYEIINAALNKTLHNFYFLLRNDISLMIKLIELSQKGDYEELSDFFVHFFFVNIINSSCADDKLILLIYLLLEKLILEGLPNKIEINNDIPATYLKDTFLYYIFKSLTRKIDIRNFLGNILNNFIQRFDNLRLTLSTEIVDVNKIVNLRNAFFYRSFITNIGSFKEEEIHLKKKKFKKSRDGNKLINTSNQNKFNFTLKRAQKIQGPSVIEHDENPDNNNVQKLTTLDDIVKNNNFIEEKKIVEEKRIIEEKESNEFKKRNIDVPKNEEKEEKEEKKEKEEKEEKNKHNRLKLNFDLNPKNKDIKKSTYLPKEKKLINPLSITKGISENSTRDPRRILENINNDEKIPVDDFFIQNDLTKEKIKEILEEYSKKNDPNNNINSAMKEYLNDLINQEEEIYSSSTYIKELISIGSIKSNQNFFGLMRKILINLRIISKVITNIINELSKNLSSISYIIKCIFKIIEQLLNKKYSQEKSNNLTPYQLYMFKMNFLIGNIILPILKNPNYNGIITSNIISLKTIKNLKIVYDIFDKMITGKLFNKNQDSSMVLFNKFIIETLPKLFELIDNFEHNIDLPNCVNRLINDNNNSSQRDINYDYFKENPEESIEYQSICISLTNLYIFMNILDLNTEILIDNNEKQEEKAILKDFIDNMDIISDIYIKEQQENKREFVYLTRVLYSDEFKNEIENICKDNTYGHVAQTNEDFVTIFKNILIKILNYANIIQYENFYDLSELKTEKTMKINKSKKLKKEESEKNSQDIWSKKKFKSSLRSSLIRIVKSKKEDDVDFKKVILPHIIKNILFEMSSDTNDELNQHISFYINYLQLHIENLPKEYVENNYSLLFDELIKETKNKIKVIWSNILFEYFKKVKEAERVNMKALEFNSQIKNLENLKYIEYLYKEIKLSNDFIIEKDKNDIISNYKYIKKDIDSDNKNNNQIQDMIKNFPDFREYENDYDNILDIEEKANIPEAIKNYFKEMGKAIKNESIIQVMNKAELTNVKCLLENYVMNQLFDKLFPTQISEEDLFIYKKCERLAFLAPENVIEKKQIINENLLNEATKYFGELDDKLTPLDKLKCIEKGISIIINSIQFTTGKDDVGFDDIVQPCIYVMLKAKPKNLATNAQYCKLHLNNSIPKNYEKTCRDLYFILDGIKSLDHKKLFGITEEQFGKDEFNLEN